MQTPGSGPLQPRRHYLSRPFSKTINLRFNMLTQSNEHRSLVWIALAEFVAEINGGLKKKKRQMPNQVQPGIQCSPQLGGGFSASQAPAQNSTRWD